MASVTATRLGHAASPCAAARRTIRPASSTGRLLQVTALRRPRSSGRLVLRLSVPITRRPSASYSRFVVVIGITVLPAVIGCRRTFVGPDGQRMDVTRLPGRQKHVQQRRIVTTDQDRKPSERRGLARAN